MDTDCRFLVLRRRAEQRPARSNDVPDALRGETTSDPLDERHAGDEAEQVLSRQGGEHGVRVSQKLCVRRHKD